MAQNILDTLAHGTIPPSRFHTPLGGGITCPSRTTIEGVAVVVKRTLRSDFAGEMPIWRERLAYVVSAATPGLVDVPATVLRLDAEGCSVSVQEFRTMGDVPRDRATIAHRVLRSDIVGLAAFDAIIANQDRRVANGGMVQHVCPTGGAACGMHGARIVAIDHGGAFGWKGSVGGSWASDIMSGLRVPQYLHDHANRIVRAERTLRDAAVEAGAPMSAVDAVLTRADRFAHAERFPLFRYPWSAGF